MEPSGLLDSDETRLLNRLVEKRVEEMQQSTFCIITNADKDRMQEEIKAELFLRTGITAVYARKKKPGTMSTVTSAGER